MKMLYVLLPVLLTAEVALSEHFLKVRQQIERTTRNQAKVEIDLVIPSYEEQCEEEQVFGPHVSCGYDYEPRQVCTVDQYGRPYCYIVYDRVLRSCWHHEYICKDVVLNPHYGEVKFVLLFDPRAKLQGTEKEIFQISYDPNEEKAYVLAKKTKYRYQKKDYRLDDIQLDQTAMFELNLR